MGMPKPAWKDESESELNDMDWQESVSYEDTPSLSDDTVSQAYEERSMQLPNHEQQ